MSRPMHEYEFEGEFEDEFEGEYEGEFEDEFESEFESEGEYEFEAEGEFEGEYEGEEFFGRLFSLARRAARHPMLRQLGLRAARSALGGLSQRGGALGAAANVAGGFLPEQEYEYEGEFEGEFEGEYEDEYESFSNPQSRLQAEALMAHLGNAAASAESEDEAEAFIGSLIPLAARVVPQAAAAVMRQAPALISGISNVARTVMNNPGTQQLLRTLPTVARNTAVDLARQVAAGRPVTTQTAVRSLARNTANVLGNPRHAVQAYQRNRALDQRYHRATGAPPAPGRTGAAGNLGRRVAQTVAGGARPRPRPTPYRGAPAGAAARRATAARGGGGCPACRC